VTVAHGIFPNLTILVLNKTEQSWFPESAEPNVQLTNTISNWS